MMKGYVHDYIWKYGGEKLKLKRKPGIASLKGK